MAKKLKMENELLQQKVGAQRSLQDLLFQPGQTETVTVPPQELSSGNLHDVIREARSGPLDSAFGVKMPSLRGYQQTAPESYDFASGSGAVVPQLRGERQDLPGPFPKSFTPSRFINHPAAELHGPGAPVQQRVFTPDEIAQMPQMGMSPYEIGQIADAQETVEGPQPVRPAYQSREPIVGMEPQLPVMSPATTRQQDVPGTAGPFAQLSPQMQQLARAMLDHSGGDYTQTASMVNLLAPSANLPVPTSYQKFGPGDLVLATDPIGRPRLDAQGKPLMIQVPQRYTQSQMIKVPGEYIRVWNPQRGVMELALDDDGNPMRMPESPTAENFGGSTGQQIVMLARQKFPQEMAALDHALGHPASFNDLRNAPSELQGKINAAWIDQKGKLMGMQQDWILGRNVEQSYEMPLGPEAAAKAGVIPGTTLGEVKKLGLSAVGPTQRQAYADFGSAVNILEDIGKYAMKVPDVQPGMFNRLTEGGRNWMNALAQTDENAAMMQTKIGELSRLVRALGESGALATKDVDRAAALVPSLFDTKSIREKKLADLHALFEENKINFLNSLGPIPGTQTGQLPKQNAAPAGASKEQEMKALYEQEKAKAKQEMMQHGTHP